MTAKNLPPYHLNKEEQAAFHRALKVSGTVTAGPKFKPVNLPQQESIVIQNLRDEITKLKVQKFAYFNNEECWIYQGDGEDHLESLVCPVVISAEKLRAILETKPQPVEMGEEGAVEVMRFAMEDYNTATNEDRITFAGSARAAFRALQAKARIVKRDA